MPQPESVREAAFYIWEGYLNTPYRWGGSDPIDGVDCSGLVLAGLQGVGILPRAKDWTAHDLLHDVFADRPHYAPGKSLRRGMLVFWKNPAGKIRHVEIVWAVYADSVLTIGASGGDSRTTSREAAAAQDAFVQIKPLPPNWVAAVDPFPVMP